MKVKIGKKIYSSNDQPIMIILEGNDKKNIKKMPRSADRYCIFDESKFSIDYIKKFMEIKK